MNVAFIGLGVMGYPMAGYQQKEGHNVCVYNRTLTKAQKWSEEYKGRYAETPAAASKGADVVMVCVGNDDDVRGVIYGEEGVLAGLSAGAMIVDHTTTSYELAKELSEKCQEKGVNFMDAPVSGGQAGAENGVLAVMLGGSEEHLQYAKVAIEPYAKSITLMGPVGAGQATKMVNQILIAGILQGISEGFTLAQKADLDLPKVIDAISAGAAGSWQLSNRGLNIDKDIFDYGFAVDWMVKDLGFCLNAAKNLGIELPNTQFASDRYKELQKKGYNRSDTSVLIKQYDK
ncbi:MAG: NAD(P)-dependent oxidoreductase [Cellvibrionaceae bacterium]